MLAIVLLMNRKVKVIGVKMCSTYCNLTIGTMTSVSSSASPSSSFAFVVSFCGGPPSSVHQNRHDSWNSAEGRYQSWNGTSSLAFNVPRKGTPTSHTLKTNHFIITSFLYIPHITIFNHLLLCPGYPTVSWYSAHTAPVSSVHITVPSQSSSP